jgi:hypothetical protein
MRSYIITRQNSDGSFDEVGMNNRCIVRGYKTYKNAFKYGINPFGHGKVCRVEEFAGDSVQGDPRQVFQTLTYAYTN